MLFAVGVVTYVAHTHRVGTDNPTVTEVSSVHDLHLKLLTNVTLQPCHHLLLTFYLGFAVKPRNSLQFFVEVLSPFLVC